MRAVLGIVIHCSDSPDALDIGRSVIDGWHKERGWKGIGYHYVIRRTGVIELGRMESQIGAHVEGHNANTIGVCWVGKDKPSDEQRDSLFTLVRELMARYAIPARNVHGHHELNAGKTCPNINMEEFRKGLA